MDFFEDGQPENQIDVQEVQSAKTPQYDAFDAFSDPQPISQPVTQPISIVSPEQQIRRDKLRQIEDERLAQIREKEQQERLLKTQKREKAQEFLAQFKTQQAEDLQARKVQNLQKQEIWIENKTTHNQYKNSWDMVASNIALRDGEYPGQKDVSKMRQAILNKRVDLSK